MEDQTFRHVEEAADEAAEAVLAADQRDQDEAWLAQFEQYWQEAA